MRNKTTYEWVMEPIDEHGDIIDPMYWGELQEAVLESLNYEHLDCLRREIALVQNIGNDETGLQERNYFYIKDGKLQPSEDGCMAPKRFQDLVAKVYRETK